MVESPGPPPVMNWISPNVCERPMNEVMSRKVRIGTSPGSVTVVNCRNAPAPSILAASYSSGGMSCSAAMTRIATYPALIHTDMITIAGSAQVWETNHVGGSSIPREVSA